MAGDGWNCPHCGWTSRNQRPGRDRDRSEDVHRDMLCPHQVATTTATCECGETVWGLLTRTGTKVRVSDAPLSNPYGFEDLGLVCPHGIRWYAIPAADQIAAWRRNEEFGGAS